MSSTDSKSTSRKEVGCSGSTAQQSDPTPIHRQEESDSASRTSNSNPMSFLLKPNKSAFFVVCGIYLMWLVFLMYVAFVNVQAGNQ